MSQKSVLRFTKFNGGISDNDYGLDIPGSGIWSASVDVDSLCLRGNPSVGSGLTETNAFPNALVGFILASDGNYYAITLTASDFMKYDGSVWTKISDTGGNGVDVCDYKDYVYYTYPSNIGRYGTLSSSPSANDDWARVDEAAGSNSWGMMTVAGEKLWILNHTTNAIDSYDGTTFLPSALDFPSKWTLVNILPLGYKLAIALNYMGKGKICFWNMADASWNWEQEFPEKIFTMCNFLEGLAVITEKGDIYYTNGTSMTYLKGFEKGYLGQPCLTLANVRANSMIEHNHRIYIGVEFGGTSKYVNGLYSIGLSEGVWKLNCEKAYTSDDLMTAMGVSGTYLLFSYYDQSATDAMTFKIPGLTNAYNSFEWQSPVFDFGTGLKKYVNETEIFTKKLVASNSLVVSYEADYSGSWTALGTISTTGTTYTRLDVPYKGRKLRLKIVGTTSGTATPEVVEVRITAIIQGL